MANIYEHKPHFVLLPLMAQGHMIPMVDIARLLAERGSIVTILTTPLNAKRIEPLINRAADSGLNVHVHHLKLPLAEAGLPEGCENFDMLPFFNDDITFKLFKATALLENQVEKLLTGLKPSPNCLIADAFFPWATNVSVNLNIPRIVFYGISCFALLCFHVICIRDGFGDVASDFEYFVLPGLPDRIEITKAQLKAAAFNLTDNWRKMLGEVREADVNAFGTVLNTFEELEPKYVEEYRKVMEGKKVWCVGPVSLCNKNELDKAERGKKASIDEHECLKWLDLRDLGSVLYVCLGSLSRLSASQLVELGLGLEASNRAFIWVVRDAGHEFGNWLLEERFEERIKGRGILVHGWAPQVLILSHKSVGGFVTHCGWNSTLEGISTGVQMLTWPVFAEQFCNEKFIVNVIKTGIRVGVEVPVNLGDEDKVGVQVKKGQIKMVIDDLMDGGEEGKERRERAIKLKEMAGRAMEEEGCSYLNMTNLIQDVICCKERV